MTNARLTIDEAQVFLDANPMVQWIDAFLFDMNGIPRGKRMRRPASSLRARHFASWEAAAEFFRDRYRRALAGVPAVRRV